MSTRTRDFSKGRRSCSSTRVRGGGGGGDGGNYGPSKTVAFSDANSYRRDPTTRRAYEIRSATGREDDVSSNSTARDGTERFHVHNTICRRFRLARLFVIISTARSTGNVMKIEIRPVSVLSRELITTTTTK